MSAGDVTSEAYAELERWERECERLVPGGMDDIGLLERIDLYGAGFEPHEVAASVSEASQ